ncbi:MAG: four helix bundle protein [Lentimicrobiaceae bacterium]|jgi:four helix bundle protein|nr:four helix bundle protein [Lentimicrobiaceae bacterium]
MSYELGMNKIVSYKDLEVWKKGMLLVTEVYSLTNSFPKDEIFGLSSQIRRAAVSIPANIAEDWGCENIKSYVQFLRVAKGSLFELETELEIAANLKYISK